MSFSRFKQLDVDDKCMFIMMALIIFEFIAGIIVSLILWNIFWIVLLCIGSLATLLFSFLVMNMLEIMKEKN